MFLHPNSSQCRRLATNRLINPWHPQGLVVGTETDSTVSTIGSSLFRVRDAIHCTFESDWSIKTIGLLVGALWSTQVLSGCCMVHSVPRLESSQQNERQLVPFGVTMQNAPVFRQAGRSIAMR